MSLSPSLSSCRFRVSRRRFRRKAIIRAAVARLPHPRLNPLLKTASRAALTTELPRTREKRYFSLFQRLSSHLSIHNWPLFGVPSNGFFGTIKRRPLPFPPASLDTYHATQIPPPPQSVGVFKRAPRTPHIHAHALLHPGPLCPLL